MNQYPVLTYANDHWKVDHLISEMYPGWIRDNYAILYGEAPDADALDGAGPSGASSSATSPATVSPSASTTTLPVMLSSATIPSAIAVPSTSPPSVSRITDSASSHDLSLGTLVDESPSSPSSLTTPTAELFTDDTPTLKRKLSEPPSDAQRPAKKLSLTHASEKDDDKENAVGGATSGDNVSLTYILSNDESEHCI